MTSDGPTPGGDAWAIEHAARTAAEAATARWARLQAATAGFSSARTPDEVAAVALDVGVAALGASRGFLLVPGPGGELEILRSMDVGDGDTRRSARQAAPNPATQAWETGLPIFVEDRSALLARWPALGARAERLRDVAVAALPLRVQDRSLGVLGIGFDAPTAFSAEDRGFADALAAQCAQALDRARLLVAERQARAEAVAAQRRLVFLADVSALLVEDLDEPDLLARVARLAAPALGDWAAVYLSPDEGPARAAEAGEPGLGAAVVARLAADPQARLAAVVAGAQACLIEPPSGAGENVGPVALVPIALQGRALGALVLASRDPGRRYAAPDLSLLEDVARRTALSLEHARVYRDTRLAAQLREEFLQVASHELRGPLGTLRLGVQLLARELRDEPPGGPRQVRLGFVTRQAERLGRLADRLLDVSRITAGRLKLEREEVDLAAVVADVVDRVAEEAAEARCELLVDAPAPVRGSLDPTRVEQVVANLVGNALKYGRGAPVEIAVREADGRAILAVRDHGIGIAPADQERIFGRFERAVPAHNFAGLGLGLWIARSLVEAHGGAIRVESTPGGGAVFTVDLPLRPDAPA